jgi:Domain of unknown function (DUF4265)
MSGLQSGEGKSMAMAIREDQPDLRRMGFDLEVVDGWPPVSVETLWVKSVGDGNFQIDNSPFFVRDLAVGDVVEGEGASGELLRFLGKVSSGGHSTVWVMALTDKARRSLAAEIKDLGCRVEDSPWPSLLSVDVPDQMHLDELHRHLTVLASTDQVEFVDACIGAS